MSARVRIGSLDGYRSDDQVRPIERLPKLVPGDHFPAETRRQIDGVLRRAVQNAQLLDPAIAQMPHHLLAGRARSDDQRAVIVQLAENAFGKFHAGKRHGNRTRAEFRFVAHALAHLEGRLKHAIEHRPGLAAVQRNLVGVANLSQNLRFAQQHRIQAGRYAEEMAHGVAVTMAVQRAVELAQRKLVERGDEQFDGAGAVNGVFARHSVEFAAIARRKDQRFLKNAARTQLFRGFPRLLGSERHALAHFDRGRAMIQSDENNFHLRDAQPASLIPAFARAAQSANLQKYR